MQNPERHKDVTIEGERFRISQMGAEDGCFLLSMILQPQQNLGPQARREEAGYRTRLHLQHCMRLKEVGGQLLAVPLGNMDAAGNEKDPLYWEHRKLVGLIEASHEYNVVDPTVAGAPEETRERLRAVLMGRDLPEDADKAKPAQ